MWEIVVGEIHLNIKNVIMENMGFSTEQDRRKIANTHKHTHMWETPKHIGGNSLPPQVHPYHADFHVDMEKPLLKKSARSYRLSRWDASG